MKDILNFLDKWGKKGIWAAIIVYLGPWQIVNFFYTVFGMVWKTIEAAGLRSEEHTSELQSH